MFPNGSRLSPNGSPAGLLSSRKCGSRSGLVSPAGQEEGSPELLITNVPIDCEYVDLLWRAADYPDASLASCPRGVRVGSDARLPRLPALCRRKKQWRLPDEADPTDYPEEQACADEVWNRNYASIEVVDVLDDQAKRGQVLKLTEHPTALSLLDCSSVDARIHLCGLRTDVTLVGWHLNAIVRKTAQNKLQSYVTGPVTSAGKS